jgi:hypothetical protein
VLLVAERAALLAGRDDHQATVKRTVTRKLRIKWDFMERVTGIEPALSA